MSLNTEYINILSECDSHEALLKFFNIEYNKNKWYSDEVIDLDHIEWTINFIDDIKKLSYKINHKQSKKILGQLNDYINDPENKYADYKFTFNPVIYDGEIVNIIMLPSIICIKHKDGRYLIIGNPASNPCMLTNEYNWWYSHSVYKCFNKKLSLKEMFKYIKIAVRNFGNMNFRIFERD